MRLEYAPTARLDLIEIGSYIHKDNPPAALRFVEAIEARCAKLLPFPEIGIERFDLSPGLRSIPFRSYVIFYTRDGDILRVERVLHGARDIAVVFDEG